MENNFNQWLIQAIADFEIISSVEDGNTFQEQAMQKYGVAIDEKILSGLFATSTVALSSPKVQHISDAPKPWYS